MTSSERPSPGTTPEKRSAPSRTGGEIILETLWKPQMPCFIGLGGSLPYSRREFQKTLWERFRGLSGISSGKSQPYWGCDPLGERSPFEWKIHMFLATLADGKTVASWGEGQVNSKDLTRVRFGMGPNWVGPLALVEKCQRLMFVSVAHLGLVKLASPKTLQKLGFQRNFKEHRKVNS